MGHGYINDDNPLLLEIVMTMPATVPLTISPEAAARIAGLDLQGEAERMIERACNALPELESIQVNVYDRYDLGDDPGISIDLYSRRVYDRGNRDGRNLIRWMVTEFPPEVLQWIIMDYHPGQGNAG
jgi:hypothetical protein